MTTDHNTIAPTAGQTNDATSSLPTNGNRSANFSFTADHLANLADFLQHSENASRSRLMLRSWFLTHALQAENPTTSNPGTIEENVQLYELFDDFLTDVINSTAKGGEAA